MKDSPFMRFWRTINEVLKDRGQPEMLFGEVRGWWEQHKGWEG